MYVVCVLNSVCDSSPGLFVSLFLGVRNSVSRCLCVIGYVLMCCSVIVCLRPFVRVLPLSCAYVFLCVRVGVSAVCVLCVGVAVSVSRS